MPELARSRPELRNVAKADNSPADKISAETTDITQKARDTRYLASLVEILYDEYHYSEWPALNEGLMAPMRSLRGVLRSPVECA